MEKRTSFSTVLKEQKVFLTGADGKEKACVIRELNGDQRAKHQDSFDFDMEYEDGKVKAVPGANYKPSTPAQFLALCLYDEENNLIPEDVIGKYPSTVLKELNTIARKLSGIDKEEEEALKKA